MQMIFSILGVFIHHVVRVILLSGNIYRVAIYLTKDNYKHQFYIATKLNSTLADKKQ